MDSRTLVILFRVLLILSGVFGLLGVALAIMDSTLTKLHKRRGFDRNWRLHRASENVRMILGIFGSVILLGFIGTMALAVVLL